MTTCPLGTTGAVLTAIKAYRAKMGYSPSIRDIMGMTDISSTSVVAYHLTKMERMGILRRTPHVARSIVLGEEL